MFSLFFFYDYLYDLHLEPHYGKYALIMLLRLAPSVAFSPIVLYCLLLSGRYVQSRANSPLSSGPISCSAERMYSAGKGFQGHYYWTPTWWEAPCQTAVGHKGQEAGFFCFFFAGNIKKISIVNVCYKEQHTCFCHIHSASPRVGQMRLKGH